MQYFSLFEDKIEYTLNGTPYTYKNFDVSIHSYWNKARGSLSLRTQDHRDDYIAIYQGSAFCNSLGVAKIYLNDIIKDGIKYDAQCPFTNDVPYLKYFVVSVNGVEVGKVFAFKRDRITTNADYYGTSGIKCHYTQASSLALLMNGTYANLKYFVGNTIYDWGSGDNDAVSSNIYGILPDASNGRQITLNTLLFGEDTEEYASTLVNYVHDLNCDVKACYMQFETPYGWLYSNGFNSVSIDSTTTSKTTITNMYGEDVVTHNNVDEYITINTGILSKMEYDLLVKSLPYTNYINVYTTDVNRQSWLCTLDNTSFEAMNNLNTNAKNRQLTIRLKKVKPFEY